MSCRSCRARVEADGCAIDRVNPDPIQIRIRYPAFSISVIGLSLASTTSRVITHFAHFLLAGSVVHQVEHQLLDDHPQAARADLALQRRLGDRLERVVGEPQLDVLVLEQLLVLTRDGVARLRQDLDERRLVELVQRADDRQAADELGDEPVLDQIFRLELLERRADVAVRAPTSRRP